MKRLSKDEIIELLIISNVENKNGIPVLKFGPYNIEYPINDNPEVTMKELLKYFYSYIIRMSTNNKKDKLPVIIGKQNEN